jgi:guanylate kinase
MKKGPLLIVSGPSGVGKSEILRRLLARKDLPLRLSVSATTRPPRAGEVDGVNYHFWTRAQFEEGIRAGAFLEWAEVFGRMYGTLRREVQAHREAGVGVILEIDVQGAAQVRRLCPDAVSIFLLAPSIEIYEQRLRQRRTESEEAIRVRVDGARRELACADQYDFRVVNDDLDHAVAEVETIARRQFGELDHAG